MLIELNSTGISLNVPAFTTPRKPSDFLPFVIAFRTIVLSIQVRNSANVGSKLWTAISKNDVGSSPLYAWISGRYTIWFPYRNPKIVSQHRSGGFKILSRKTSYNLSNTGQSRDMSFAEIWCIFSKFEFYRLNQLTRLTQYVLIHILRLTQCAPCWCRSAHEPRFSLLLQSRQWRFKNALWSGQSWSFKRYKYLTFACKQRSRVTTNARSMVIRGQLGDVSAHENCARCDFKRNHRF